MYNLDFDEQHAEYVSNEINEIIESEKILHRDPTKYSLEQVDYYSDRLFVPKTFPHVSFILISMMIMKNNSQHSKPMSFTS